MKILYSVVLASTVFTLSSSRLMGFSMRGNKRQPESKIEKQNIAPIGTETEPFVVFGIDGLISYLYPLSDRVRAVCGNGWADYTLEVFQTYDNKWTVWERVDWWQKEGNSTCLHTKTKMRLLSFKLGLDYQFNLTTDLDLYVGAGLDYNLLRIYNHSSFVKQHTQKNEFGFLTQTGLNYHFTKHFYAKFNLEYLYQKFYLSKHTGHSHVRRNNVDLSCIQVGGGVGVSF
jgi:opacity protein-like surface antigen